MTFFLVEVWDGSRWCPSMMSTEENQAWELAEDHDRPHRVVQVDSWQGQVVAVSDSEGLVEPVAFA